VCTLALYFQLFDGLPLLVAANRDEYYDRPSAEPAVVGTTPRILAGRDLRAGGTWLGANEHGLLVGILNRRANGAALPPLALRSRGQLCMDLLTHNSAAKAAAAIEADNHRYNPFTVMFADESNAFAAYNNGHKIETRRRWMRGCTCSAAPLNRTLVHSRPTARRLDSPKRRLTKARVGHRQAGSRP
jgi:uncharacterized protein with NRDE domain